MLCYEHLASEPADLLCVCRERERERERARRVYKVERDVRCWWWRDAEDAVSAREDVGGTVSDMRHSAPVSTSQPRCASCHSIRHADARRPVQLAVIVVYTTFYAFYSALTLWLGGRKGIRPVKN